MAALYAFLLQPVLQAFFQGSPHAVLGGLMPMPALAGGLCVAQGPTDPAGGTSVPHDHGACCTAAQIIGAPSPDRIAGPAAWPPIDGRRLAWTTPEAPRARAPPGRIAPARGPPAS